MKTNILLELWRYLSQYKRVLIAASIALIFTAAVTLSMGQGVRYLIDDGFVAGSSAELNRGALFIIGIALLMATGTFVRFYLVSWLGERVTADLRKRVFEHLVQLHPAYFESNQSGEIMSRLTADTSLIQSVIGSSASMALRSVLTFIGGLSLLMITNIKLSLLVLACVPIVLLPILFFGRRVRTLSRKSQDSIADVGSYAGEVLQQIKTVQSYTQEHQEAAAFGAHAENAFKIAKQRIAQRALLIAVVISAIFSAIAILLWVGGNDVLSGEMSAGELGAFVFYALIVASAVATISEVVGELQRAAGAAERLFELLAVVPEVRPPSAALPVPEGDADIEIQALSFFYPSKPKQAALEEINISIPAGQSLALVGPSGAGKSTLFDLLQRFYDPQTGLINIGGIDIRRLNPNELRNQMALVSQHPILFSQSVRHNIAYGNPDASENQIMAAAKAAHANDFIEQLPQGYESYLGEHGVRLSGGQRQRIAIARAILKDPKILLLDEATSALDAESEHQVQLALDALTKQRTSIVIAHRLATIRNADRIVVLDSGRIVATGKHEDLIASSPLYRRLAELQFQTEISAPMPTSINVNAQGIE